MCVRTFPRTRVCVCVCLSEDVSVCVRNAVITSLISGAMITLSESLALCLYVPAQACVCACVCACGGKAFVLVCRRAPIVSWNAPYVTRAHVKTRQVRLLGL